VSLELPPSDTLALELSSSVRTKLVKLKCYRHSTRGSAKLLRVLIPRQSGADIAARPAGKPFTRGEMIASLGMDDFATTALLTTIAPRLQRMIRKESLRPSPLAIVALAALGARRPLAIAIPELDDLHLQFLLSAEQTERRIGLWPYRPSASAPPELSRLHLLYPLGRTNFGIAGSGSGSRRTLLKFASIPSSSCECTTHVRL